MKIKYNTRTFNLEYQVEENDFVDAIKIEEMLQGKTTCHKCGTESESNGWKVLMGYVAEMRLRLEEVGKAHAEQRVGKDKCVTDFAKLAGFDYVVGLPARIVAQANILRDTLNKTKEVSHESRHDDEI